VRWSTAGDLLGRQIRSKDEAILKILYELTYATRGQSGIPRDAASVAKMLVNEKEFETELVLNPRTYIRRSIFKLPKENWESDVLGSALRREPGRSVLPPIFTSGLILLQSLSFKRKISFYFLSEKLNLNALDHLKLPKLNGALTNTRVALMSLSYLARFARPAFLKPFMLSTSEYDVFIQQQVDPMNVGKNTIHVVRLHDFLPVTHPQLFDQNAVKIFTKSLRVMLKGNKKIWVMDSERTAKEFKEYFGADLDVRVIPCSITPSKSGGAQNTVQRKNQICIVNTIEPRKRVSLAISGFREAKSLGKLSPDWELVIIGAEGWQEGNLASGLRKGVFGKDIIFKESATDFELQQVFSESKIVLSAAVAEGFGLPPLEGMINGCIPVVSDIPQHRETVRENGLYFSGDDPTAIADALKEACLLIEQNGPEIATKLREFVEANYSEKVIGKMWLDFIKSLKK
jgi:glycosyltransferase involved in cell wall biosynthesis